MFYNENIFLCLDKTFFLIQYFKTTIDRYQNKKFQTNFTKNPQTFIQPENHQFYYVLLSKIYKIRILIVG